MILTLSALDDLSVSRQGQRVVAACGCFDIFHIGHLEYLQGAKQLGDRLVVGVNSDWSVYRNKGKHPHFSQDDRIALRCAINVVDDVICFNSITFGPVLSRLRPQVFARGVDAEHKGFPERETVERLGIEVAVIGASKRASSRYLRPYLQ